MKNTSRSGIIAALIFLFLGVPALFAAVFEYDFISVVNQAAAKQKVSAYKYYYVTALNYPPHETELAACALLNLTAYRPTKHWTINRPVYHGEVVDAGTPVNKYEQKYAYAMSLDYLRGITAGGNARDIYTVGKIPMKNRGVVFFYPVAETQARKKFLDDCGVIGVSYNPENQNVAEAVWAYFVRVDVPGLLYEGAIVTIENFVRFAMALENEGPNQDIIRSAEKIKVKIDNKSINPGYAERNVRGIGKRFELATAKMHYPAPSALEAVLNLGDWGLARVDPPGGIFFRGKWFSYHEDDDILVKVNHGNFPGFRDSRVVSFKDGNNLVRVNHVWFLKNIIINDAGFNNLGWQHGDSVFFAFEELARGAGTLQTLCVTKRKEVRDAIKGSRRNSDILLAAFDTWVQEELNPKLLLKPQGFQCAPIDEKEE